MSILDWLFGGADDTAFYQQKYGHSPTDRHNYGVHPDFEECQPRGPVRHEAVRGYKDSAASTTNTRSGGGVIATQTQSRGGYHGYHGYHSEKVDQYMRDVDSVLRSCGESGVVCNGSINFRRGTMTINLSHPVQNGRAVARELSRSFGRRFHVNGSAIRVDGEL